MEIKKDDPQWIPEDDPRWVPWVPTKEKMPEVGTVVVAILQHWHTKGLRQTELIIVDEGDCSFRTTDDNSEISYDWDITHWMEI